VFRGETAVLGGAFDVSAAIAELELRGFCRAIGLDDAQAFRLSLEPEFVRGCFGEATLRVNEKEVEVSKAGVLLLRQSESALEELISLLRLERVVPRNVSELREVTRRVGLEWAIDFDGFSAGPASDPDLADLVELAIAAPVGAAQLADLFELEAAVSSRHPLEALSKTALFRTGDWQSVIEVLFRFTRARPSRWRETSHALKEILRQIPESSVCLDSQGKFSVGEQLLWLSIDGFDRVSVAGSLDPTRPNFAFAWREFHGRGRSALMAALAIDDLDGLRQHSSATGEPNSDQYLRVVSVGGDVFKASKGDTRDLSVLAVAAQEGAVRCARFLLTNGANVGAPEVEAAFRGGSVELMRLLWDAFPYAKPTELALEAVRSWNATGLRWLLQHKLGALSFDVLIRLFKGSCSCGSYSCASSVLDSSESASQLRLQHPVGIVGRVLCGEMGWLKTGQSVSLIREDSMAAEYSVELREWLPEATEFRLVTTHEGRGAASVNAFIDAAMGRAKTLTVVETENGGSICGGYLDVAWNEGGFTSDPGGRS
jgi:hypothetical protein